MRRTMRRMLLGVVGAGTAVALAIPGAVFAKGPGGGGGEDPAARFNLSVPAVFVGGANPYGLTCDGTAVEPAGDPSTGFSVDPTAYYFVQGENAWRAGCVQGVAAAEARAEWGDNLSGDAKLKVGSPIRVEVGLFAETVTAEPGDMAAPVPAMTGWVVEKLEPSMLDRESPYGTLAAGDPASGFESYPVNPFPETRAWASGAWLTIYPVGQPNAPVVDEATSAEVNATGRVVYGYNLRVNAIGSYVIEYTFPGVTITGVDAGTYQDSTVTLDITVVGGGGGGGGKGRR